MATNNVVLGDTKLPVPEYNDQYATHINVIVTLSKARICGQSIAGNKCSNSGGGMEVFFFVSDVHRQVEVSVMGRSLVQRSHTDCGVTACYLETSNMRRL
jgi:hypothetical protein